MIRAFSYYLARSLKNRLMSRLRRLRRAKYLISALAGVVYLALVFLPQLFHAGPPVLTAPMPAGALAAVQAALSLLLLIVVMIPWIWPGRDAGILFTEAETQFLFGAPVTRQSLLRLRMAKTQAGIIFGVGVSVLIFGRGRYFEHPLFLAIALWIVYSFIALYRMGASLLKTSLAEHGAIGLKRHWWALAFLLAMALLIFGWLLWFVPLPGPREGRTPALLLGWFLAISQSGPAYYLLMPFRWLIRPAFAPDVPAFALALLPALGLLTLAYVWVMRTDADFREAALARAREAADRVRAGKGAEMRRAARVSAKRRRPPFRLSPRGSAQVAIFWKNLISAGRLSPRRFAVFALAIGTITVVFWGGRRDGGQFIAAAIGTMAGIMAGCLTLIGPLLIRDDLRSDLLHVDLLKTFPIAGWRLVLGEVLAPAALLTLIEWVLLVLAAVLLPAAGEVSLTMSGRAGYGLAAAVMLPLISAIGVIVQNAVALLMPGWVELGKRHARGVEAMGQRLISMVGTALVLILASIPVGFVFAAAYFSGYWLLGPAVVPVAIAIAAAGLALESAIAVALLGRVFDRFDPSRELDAF